MSILKPISQIFEREADLSSNNEASRLSLERLIIATETSPTTQGSDVIYGLSKSPKTLPAKYFYDDRGSELFEQICALPEYYLTRTETNILQNCAAEIAQITGSCELVELGSGSSVKTRILLDAYNSLGYPLRYLPIDISAGILESSAFALLNDYPTLEVHGLVGTYELALSRLALPQLPTRMLCFVGSTLGNLTPPECDVFFAQIVNALQVGEYFLLGVDLQKSTTQLESAYNDAQGVTAAFNLNMLHHLNRKFSGNFDPSKFEHSAIYNESLHRIEMHLKSLEDQTVNLRSLNLTVAFKQNETIMTEISRKFDLDQIATELEHRGLKKVQIWTDANQWFGLLLCQLGG